MKILRSKYQENISKGFAARSNYRLIHILDIFQRHYHSIKVYYNRPSTIHLINNPFFQKEIYKNIYN